ncbi:RNA polymerase sigma factor, sigma-70 family [Dokdonia sp. MED134]|nr:RNA polymerase sigma factor, sigma-70 family [Dokdonia sp. MED134]
MKYCKNRDEAQDNLQDSFVTIFTKINTYKNAGSFEGWMKRIVINKAIDRYKRKPYLESIDDHQVQEEDTTIDQDDTAIPLQTLLKLVQELPDRYRLVFNLYQLDNYTHKEIAMALNISQGTSKSNLHRAKLILKERIIALTAAQKNSIVNGN